MPVRQHIPEDLAQLPPGPGLAGVLAGLELSRLSGLDLLEVVRARYRQANHERARLLAAVAESGLVELGPDDDLPRRSSPDCYAADEIRAALVLTRRAAENLFWLADDLTARLPAVWGAMDAGDCDEPRARIFSEWTTELSPEHARAICDALLPRVGELTTGQLIEAIKTHAVALDPDWAQRRYEQALADRKIVGRRNPDGTANLSGYNLPVDRVAAASARIDALAKAAKHAGSDRLIDHLRADLYLGMVDGSYVGLDDTTILSLLLAEPAPEPGTATDTDPVDTERAEPAEGRDGAPGDDHADESLGEDEGGDGAGEGRTDRGPRRPGAWGARSRGLELRVRLSTLLGRDDHPGELAGWGPVHAGLARDLIGMLERGQWRFAVVDEQGRLLSAGITRARPTVSPRVTPPQRAEDVVELAVPATLLTELATAGLAELGIWHTLITDLASQHAKAEAGRAAAADSPGAEGADPDGFAGDAGRRMPGAAQRRYLQLRDRRCVGVGCRVPARGADADHTRDHARGGPSLPGNLGHLCQHDHSLKHDGGWRLEQPEPGVFRWTTRLGQTFTVRPPPIIEPLPDPRPGLGYHIPVWTRSDHGWQDSVILEPEPPEPEPPPPRPPPDPDDDPPPF